MYMKRFIFDDLLGWKKRKGRKPLLLMGARQVGKTYILQQFANQSFPKAHYFNFEKTTSLAKLFEKDLEPKRLISELSFSQNQSIDIKNDLIIFDEIQACPKALTSLKYFQEELPQLALAAAGSLLGIHLLPTSFPVGKVEMLHLYPMSFEEFLIALEDDRSLPFLHSKNIPDVVHAHLWEQFKLYFIVGGMPEVVSTYLEYKHDLFTACTKVREQQEMLITAYYADFTKHSGKVNAMHIDRIFHTVPTQLQNSYDKNASRFKFSGVIPGVTRYSKLASAIDWLVAAGLVIKVNITTSGTLPFKAHTKDNIFKLYLFDIGLLGSMCDLAPKALLDADYGSYKGFFAENYVAIAFQAKKRQHLYCWQEKMAEVEFVREIDGKAIPIEVKSGINTKAKSLSVFTQKYHCPYCIILSGKNINTSTKRYHLPLYLADDITRLID